MGLPSVTRTKKQATIQSYAHPRLIPGQAPSKDGVAVQPDPPMYPDGLAAKATRQTKQHR